MPRAMRIAISLAVLLLQASSAAASSPAFPICDAEPGSGFLATVDGTLGTDCPIRWIESEPVAGGITFELHTAGGELAGTGHVTEPDTLGAPQTRHECDGTIDETTRPVFAYTARFLTAQPGDQVWVIDHGNAIATATYRETGGCAPLELAAEECQVCVPEATMGCADAGGGGGGLALALVGLALVVARGSASRR
jgi:hypothetical protein